MLVGLVAALKLCGAGTAEPSGGWLVIGWVIGKGAVDDCDAGAGVVVAGARIDDAGLEVEP